MDYEKKYNEALKRARNIKSKILQSHLSTESCMAVSEYIDEIIPELRESEDERIRRTLVEYFGPKVQLDFVRGIPIQKIRDWLEKQKEQKQTDLPAGFYYIDLNGNRYYSKEFRYGDMKLKVGEQKPAEWSEEDADMLNCCISSIEEAKENRYAYKETDGDTSYDREIAWLKSLRPDTFQNGNSRPKTSDNWKPAQEQEEPEYYQHFDPDC